MSKGASFNVAGAIHPLVGSILGSMGAAETTIFQGEMEAALRHLKAALAKVKTQDKPADLVTRIDQERAYLAQLQPSRRNERMRVNIAYYEGLNGEVYDLLWEKGYLSGEAFGKGWDLKKLRAVAESDDYDEEGEPDEDDDDQ